MLFGMHQITPTNAAKIKILTMMIRKDFYSREMQIKDWQKLVFEKSYLHRRCLARNKVVEWLHNEGKFCGVSKINKINTTKTGFIL